MALRFYAYSTPHILCECQSMLCTIVLCSSERCIIYVLYEVELLRHLACTCNNNIIIQIIFDVSDMLDR